MNIAIRHITWMPSWRIIPSRFPPIDLFERVTDAADLDAVLALESLTNDRVRAEVGRLDLIPPEDRLAGPGTSAIMAAFTHLNPDGSRFSDGNYGVYYAGNTLETSIAETRYHREQFMLATDQPPMELDMRVYLTDLDAQLHDIRGLRNALPAIYAANDYSASQAFGRRLRDQNSWGIAYDSVRQGGGECVGVFRPPALRNCRQERHLCYVWDGQRINTIYRKSAL
jgi:hypothetical protein